MLEPLIGIEETLTQLVRLLVELPEQVRVTLLSGASPVTYQVEVAHPDLGRVIGQKGRTARALRTILQACGQLRETHFALDIVPPALSPTLAAPEDI